MSVASTPALKASEIVRAEGSDRAGGADLAA